MRETLIQESDSGALEYVHRIKLIKFFFFFIIVLVGIILPLTVLLVGREILLSHHIPVEPLDKIFRSNFINLITVSSIWLTTPFVLFAVLLTYLLKKAGENTKKYYAYLTGTITGLFLAIGMDIWLYVDVLFPVNITYATNAVIFGVIPLAMALIVGFFGGFISAKLISKVLS